MLGSLRWLVALVSIVGACQPRGGGASAPVVTVVERSGAPTKEKSARKHPPRIHAKREPRPVPRPSKPMNLAEAQRYMLRLVNRDRESEGLEPLVWDDIAERAGQEHANDMASHGYTAHWGTDGSVPEQRYTAAGGAGMVQENAGCFFDNVERKLDKAPLITAESLEKIESAFFHEEPPNDGHRKNILTPWHNRIGIGLAQPVGVPVPCVAQEMVDAYGALAPLPRSASVGQTVHVAGSMASPAAFGGIGVARVDRPAPRTAAELNATHTYPVPRPFVLYFPPGFVTPKPVRVTGNQFSLDLPLDDDRKPGLYEVSVWAHVPERPELTMVSLRTVMVE